MILLQMICWKAVRDIFKPLVKLSVIFWSLVFLAPATLYGQEQPAPGEAIFTIFVNSVPVGVERVGVEETQTGWKINSSGRIAGPINLNIESFEVEYDTSWKPRQLLIDGTRSNTEYDIHSKITEGSANSNIRDGNQETTELLQINPRAIILPDFFFGAYEALAVRLSQSREGDTIPVFVPPRGEITAVIQRITTQQIQTAQTQVSALIYRTLLRYENQQLEADIWVDQRQRLLRVNLPQVKIDVARQDLSLVSTRLTSQNHPGDIQVRVPARGFSIASTVTIPVDHQQPEDGWPAIILVPGTGLVDRDENIDGVPLFAQLATGLAELGHLVVRYDKRGVGQSGGRPESAGLEEYSDDVRAVVEHVIRRKDVDRDRIVVLGHGEGGWIALNAAYRERAIDNLILLATPGTPGTELVLEQQKNRLGWLEVPQQQQTEQTLLQTQIINAVLGQRDWDGIPEHMRRRADTAWFRSFLEFDPEDVIRRTRQPMLIIHGELDQQIPIHHSDRLSSFANDRRRRESTSETIRFPNIDHVLVSFSETGLGDYTQLFERQVSKELINSIDQWINNAANRKQ